MDELSPGFLSSRRSRTTASQVVNTGSNPVGNTKVCKDCGVEKPLTGFHKDGPRKDNGKTYLQSYCKPCKGVRSKINSDNVRRKLYEYMHERACRDCGEPDRIVLEFAHRAGEIKVGNIADLCSRWGWEKLLTEIVKCDILCANCHRRETAKEQGWYKYI